MLALGDVEGLAERSIQIVVIRCALTANCSGAETGGRLFAIRADAVVGDPRYMELRTDPCRTSWLQNGCE